MDRRLFLRSALAAGVAGAAHSRQLLAAQFALLTEVSSDIAAVTGDRKPAALLKAEVQELADSLRGNLLLPGNSAYEKARRALNADIDKPSTRGYYSVDTADESQQEIHDNYEANINRLRSVKDRYDPDNLFQLNANILPTSAG